MVRALTHRLQPHLDRWLERRIPPAAEIRLDQKRVFIFPTRAGFLYLALALLLLLTAINYQNNGIYLLAFLLLGQFVVAILATYSNLAGLSLRRSNHSPGFAGDQVTFRLHLQRRSGRPYCSIRIGWPGQHMALADLDLQTETVVELYHMAPQRGRLRPARLLVETVYPFGLLRAWTWLDLNMESWVYPRPGRVSPLPVDERDVGSGLHPSVQRHDEFTNIRHWRVNDPPKQVLWKAYAKQQPLMTMEYTESVLREIWIDEALAPGCNLEERLSALCYTVLQIHQRGVLYGLRLGGREFQPGEGDEHLHRLLVSLARYRVKEIAG